MSASGVVIGTSISGVHEISANGYRSSLDLNRPLEMNQSTNFDLASLTKIIATTSSVMALVEEGLLGVDDLVSKYLPTWKTSEKQAITLRHLLQHRAGLLEWQPLYILASEPDSVHRLIATTPIRYGINQARHYSDLGFITLGKVITTVTEKNLIESIDELVLGKLPLSSMQFATAKDMDNVAATSRGDRFEKTMVESKVPYPVIENSQDFDRWRTHILSGEVNDGNAFHLFAGASSHAGLFSNAEDLLVYCDSLLNSQHFEYFTADGVDTDFHLGFMSWTDTYGACAARFYGHTGFTGVALLVSPAHQSAMTMLTNRLHTDLEIIPTQALLMPYIKEFHAKLH
ncbi:MAG: serine hydrolase domain-containing protein [Candidatus Planktophila sp.]|nr:serine hydrolase domain-containing protein [Candidatus Planktophila sp.]